MKQIYPEPTVGALIFNAEGKLLLVRSHKWRDKYVVPGGHIELGESILEALHREVREETGLEIRDVEYLGMQEFIFDRAFWKKRHFIFFDYACKTDIPSVTLNEESEEHLWATLKEAAALPVEPYTRRSIEMYLQKHP